MELAPDRSTYWNALGLVYYRLGQYTQAVEKLEQSLSKGKDETTALNLFFLAMCHARLGDVPKAKDCYDRAARWMQEQDKLPADRKKDLDSCRAEAEAVLRQAVEDS